MDTQTQEPEQYFVECTKKLLHFCLAKKAQNMNTTAKNYLKG